MRVFRIKQRLVSQIHNGIEQSMNRAVKHRDYIGIDKLKKFGKETYERYHTTLSGRTYVGEVWEYLDDKWVIINDKIFDV